MYVVGQDNFVMPLATYTRRSIDVEQCQYQYFAFLISHLNPVQYQCISYNALGIVPG